MKRILLILCLFAPATVGSGKALPFVTVLSKDGLASLEPGHTNLKAGMDLSEGDRVTVMADSKLRMKLENGSVIELGPHSDLMIRRDRLGTIFLRLAHGKLLVANRGKGDLKVRAGEIDFLFQSEGFYIDYKHDKPALVAVYAGEADVKWPKGKTKFSAKNREQASFIYPGKEAVVPAGKSRNDASADDFTSLKENL
jgi:hypothetical protein